MFYRIGKSRRLNCLACLALLIASFICLPGISHQAHAGSAKQRLGALGISYACGPKVSRANCRAIAEQFVSINADGTLSRKGIKRIYIGSSGGARLGYSPASQAIGISIKSGMTSAAELSTFLATEVQSADSPIVAASSAIPGLEQTLKAMGYGRRNVDMCGDYHLNVDLPGCQRGLEKLIRVLRSSGDEIGRLNGNVIPMVGTGNGYYIGESTRIKVVTFTPDASEAEIREHLKFHRNYRERGKSPLEQGIPVSNDESAPATTFTGV